MLSIIIPTKNEQELLPRLLESIKEQKYKDYEIIVADAGSEDRTQEVAKQYGCKIIQGGLPSKGRNEGAKVAKGELLLFLDADVALKGDLAAALEEFEQRNLDVASCFLQTFNETKIAKLLYEIAYNAPIRLLENILPHGGDFMIARKELHEKIGGFDKEVKMSEDHEYMRRGAEVGRFGLLRSIKTITSPRRYEQDGWIKICAKFVACELYMVFVGPVKSDIFVFRFDPYSEEKRIFKAPWSQYKGWRAPLLLFWFVFAIILLGIWYLIVAFLFVFLGIKKIFKSLFS